VADKGTGSAETLATGELQPMLALSICFGLFL